MKPIYINGIGVAIPDINELEELWQLLESEKVMEGSRIYEIPTFISSRKIRRMDRFSILALYGAYSVFNDLSKLKSELDPYEVGSVYSSDFGPLNTILEFSECLPDDGGIEASPVTFANTVTNACVGHVCIETGLKGASTMMIASNYIGYAMQLIYQGRVKSVLAGGLDEYNEALFDTFNKTGIDVCEGVSTMLLSQEKMKDSFCEIVAYSEINLGNHHCFSEKFEPNSSDIKRAINNTLTKANLCADDIDTIITASNYKKFTEREVDAIQDVFGHKVDMLHPKYILGESLGASLGVNLTVGALILKQQKIPHKNLNKEIKYVLVSDFNVSGNYTTFILKK